MASKLAATGAVEDFLNDPEAGIRMAGAALEAGWRILDRDGDAINDETYRAFERALVRAGNASTVGFVRETLSDIFVVRPAAVPGPR